MNFIATLLENRFYRGWNDRFEDNTSEFITPDNKTVQMVSREALRSSSVSDVEVAEDAWRWTYNNIKYKLSREWKTPEQTINERVGDCEDVTFLMASMLPNMGVEDNVVVVGEIVFPNGDSQYHTWNVVDGRIFDATGSLRAMEASTYNAEKRYRIQVN